MKVLVVAVGRSRGIFSAPIEEYEKRAGRYFSFEAVEVKEEPARRASEVDRVRTEEGKRLLERVPAGYLVVALDPEGRTWSSESLAERLAELALHSAPGIAFVIGGAYGLSPDVLSAAQHRLSLSGFTLPHEMARLVLAEQLYRAGTIQRGEPYHK